MSSIRTVTLAISLALGLGAPAFAGCDSNAPERLAEGDWTGSWQKETDLRGGDANFRMDYKLYGTIRFHVDKDGIVGDLTGEFNVDAPISIAGKETSGNGAGRVRSKLAVPDGRRDRSDSFRAESGGEVTVRGTAHNSSGGSQNISAGAAASAQLEFHLSAATCDSGSGVLDSPTFQLARDLAAQSGFTVALDTPGRWTVTNSAVADKAKRIREQTRSALSACSSFLSDTDRCMPAVALVAEEIRKEQDAVLRNCLTEAWREEVSKVIKVWIKEAIELFRANAEGEASVCFMYPYVGKAMKLATWFALLAEQCDIDQQQKAMFDAIVDLYASYDRRVAKGASMREVYGTPCPAMDKDPANAAATQQFLDRLYKSLGLTAPKPLVVR